MTSKDTDMTRKAAAATADITEVAAGAVAIADGTYVVVCDFNTNLEASFQAGLVRQRGGWNGVAVAHYPANQYPWLVIAEDTGRWAGTDWPTVRRVTFSDGQVSADTKPGVLNAVTNA